jgi:2-C-methyl-D-erythritol 4-phosphate cytidylyltransferase
VDTFILLAGGGGERAGGGVNKVYRQLNGTPLIAYPLRAIRAFAERVDLIVVARREDRPLLDKILSDFSDLKARVVIGGNTRQRSESAGLEAAQVTANDLIGIHDAARPFLTASLWEACRSTAAMIGGAIPVVSSNSLFRFRGEIMERLEGVVRAQTPQVFSGPELVAAFRTTRGSSFDTAETVERFSDLAIATVPGDARHLKVTVADDFYRAESMLEGWSPERWLIG